MIHYGAPHETLNGRMMDWRGRDRSEIYNPTSLSLPCTCRTCPVPYVAKKKRAPSPCLERIRLCVLCLPLLINELHLLPPCLSRSLVFSPPNFVLYTETQSISQSL